MQSSQDVQAAQNDVKKACENLAQSVLSNMNTPGYAASPEIQRGLDRCVKDGYITRNLLSSTSTRTFITSTSNTITSTTSNGNSLPLKLQWVKEWGNSGDDAYRVATGNSATYLLIASSNDYIHSWNGYLVKYDSAGIVKWFNQLYEKPTDLAVKGDYVYLVGERGDYGGPLPTAKRSWSDMFLMTYNSEGKLLLNKTYPEESWKGGFGASTDREIPKKVVVLDDKILIAGVKLPWIGGAGSFGTGDFLILSLDLQGNMQWHKSWPSSTLKKELFYPSKIAITDSFVYLAATLSPSNGFQRVLIEKHDFDGSLKWNRTVEKKDWAYIDVESIAAQDGSIYIGGHVSRFVDGRTEESDVLLMKYSADGTLEWQKIWGDKGADKVKSIVVTQNTLYVVGTIGVQNQVTGTYYPYLFLHKYAPNGYLLYQTTWAKSMLQSPMPNSDITDEIYPSQLAVNQDSVYVAGRTFWDGGFLLRYGG
ncbi:MAG: hypothetical protein HYY22_01230 [Thaumarchaeota archaeon]|nr:hypothetical protein [Nitrososphaerota archaeon]